MNQSMVGNFDTPGKWMHRSKQRPAIQPPACEAWKPYTSYEYEWGPIGEEQLKQLED